HAISFATWDRLWRINPARGPDRGPRLPTRSALRGGEIGAVCQIPNTVWLRTDRDLPESPWASRRLSSRAACAFRQSWLPISDPCRLGSPHPTPFAALQRLHSLGRPCPSRGGGGTGPAACRCCPLHLASSGHTLGCPL